MKIRIVLALLGLLGTAAAQQKVPVTYAPVTIDGVTTPNGMVTINGKTYVLTTALTAQGAALLKTNSIGLYRYPTAQNQPLVLKGCMGEWLYNGVDRVRVDSVTWNSQAKWFDVNVSIQTSRQNVEAYRHFDFKNMIVAYQDGRVIQPAKTLLQEIGFSKNEGGFLEPGRLETGRFYVKNPDDTDKAIPTKLVIPSGDVMSPSKAMSFDLTCKK